MRGLIIADDIQKVGENRVSFNSGLNPEKIKNSLLYWDKITHISLPDIPVSPNNDFIHDLKTLQQEKILSNIILVRNDEIKVKQLQVPSYIENDNLSIVDYEPILYKDNIKGVGFIRNKNNIIMGEGLQIGNNKMRVKEIYTNTLISQVMITKKFNQEKNGFWSIGQSSLNFEMPLIKQITQETPVLELTLNNLVPFPIISTPIDEILKFKERYQDELVAFQLALSKLNRSIEDAQGDFRVIQNCKDEINISLSALHKTLDESKIQKGLGIVKTLLDIRQISSAQLIGGAVGAAVGHYANVPLDISAISGYAFSGFISLVSKKDKKIDQLDKSIKDYAYLYYAEKTFKK